MLALDKANFGFPVVVISDKLVRTVDSGLKKL